MSGVLFELEAVQPAATNPMLEVYGPGPDGALCGACEHFVRRWKSYHKCELRRMSRSEATDHRVRWPACSRFVPAP